MDERFCFNRPTVPIRYKYTPEFLNVFCNYPIHADLTAYLNAPPDLEEENGRTWIMNSGNTPIGKALKFCLENGMTANNFVNMRIYWTKKSMNRLVFVKLNDTFITFIEYKI